MEKKKYFANLYDTTERTHFMCVFQSSTKTLKEIKDAYYKAREEWYKDDSITLFEYIQQDLAKQGIEFDQVCPDIELMF